MKKFLLFFLIVITACSPQVTSTPETSDVFPTGTMTLTSEVLTETPSANETTHIDPPTPTVIGTLSAGGIDDLATIYLSPTGTLEAELNLFNSDNPIPFDLANGVYKLGMGFSGYTYDVSRTVRDGYEYFMDGSVVKIAFGGPGTYNVRLEYILTPTAGGSTITGILELPFNVTGSNQTQPSSGGGGNGEGGSDDGGGGGNCTPPLVWDPDLQTCVGQGNP